MKKGVNNNITIRNYLLATFKSGCYDGTGYSDR